MNNLVERKREEGFNKISKKVIKEAILDNEAIDRMIKRGIPKETAINMINPNLGGSTRAFKSEHS